MDLMELLEKGDVEAFNAARPESGKLDLFAADLADKSLAGVDLSRARLDKSDLTGADLSDATLLGASLSGIDGSGMKLIAVLAIKAKAKEAWLDESDLSEADFTRGNFTEAVLERSVATGVVFAGARLVQVNAKGASWTDADLVEAVLHKIDFSGADLRRADLSEASGAEANFSEAKLDNAVGNHARFPGANFAGASLVGARFAGANLADADLSGADLSNADFSGANLTGANIEGAQLRGAVLADACLDGLSLEGFDLYGADLSGVDPTPLGLTAEQLEQVAAVGVEVNPDAPLAVKGAVAAQSKKATLTLWENTDGPEQTSLRFAVFGAGETVTSVLPVPADKVLARSVGPDGDGFRVAVLRDRPGGVALVVYRVEPDGAISSAVSTGLGYEPMVWPVLGEDGGPLLWSIARRGPTLVIHRPGEGGFGAVGSDRVPTARGFLGRHHPVVSCKGGVLLVATSRKAGAPKRTPDGFPGRLGSAAPVDDRVLCAWVIERVGDTPGGIRTAWLERRGAPETEVLTTNDLVTSLDVLGIGEHAWLCWVEIGIGGGQAWRCRLPDGAPQKVAEGVDATRACFASVADGEPSVAITVGDGEGLVLVDAKGKQRMLAEFA